MRCRSGRIRRRRRRLGLYAEQFSGTAFTVPRASNKRTWTYRIRPSVMHKPFERRSTTVVGIEHVLTRLMSRRISFAGIRCRFRPNRRILSTASRRSRETAICFRRPAWRIHIYACNKGMGDRYFYNADGEMLIVPEMGRLGILTSLGVLQVGPGRGCCHSARAEDSSVETASATDNPQCFADISAKITASSFVCPISGRSVLTDLPIRVILKRRSRGTRTAKGQFEQVAKFGGNLWSCEIDHSPLDVVAWHGNYAPYRYDLQKI